MGLPGPVGLAPSAHASAGPPSSLGVLGLFIPTLTPPTLPPAVPVGAPLTCIVLDLAATSGPPCVPALPFVPLPVSSSGLLTMTSDGRIMATATAQFVVTESSAAISGAQLECDLAISDGTGPLSGLTPMGLRSVHTGVTPAIFSGDTRWQVTVVGAAEKPGGMTYNVALRCGWFPFAGGFAAFQGGNLIVWAVAD